MPSIQLRIGLDVIASYRRLAYTPWHAIAEFVDNSTQSYFDNRDVLNKAYAREQNVGLNVSITYDREQENGFLRVVDNAMGMSAEELGRAMHVAFRPSNPTGRSRYGMGLKTAACWIGNRWSIRTKRLGEASEHQVTIDVAAIAAGDGDLSYQARHGQPSDTHYTVIEITDHNRKFQGRTLGKIRDFLRSMYRGDFRNSDLTLVWQDEALEWQEPTILQTKDGSYYRKDFHFAADGKEVHGWVGLLARGSRASAGFSILHCGRVVKGWPDSWRPSTLYGQIQGSNDLVNQRLVGEILLDDFEISHTKDDILWLGSQEESVEAGLKEHCWDYREVARTHRTRETDDERGPSTVEVEVAVDEIKRELQSSEMVDKIAIEIMPPPEAIEHAKRSIVERVTQEGSETFRATLGDYTIKVFLPHNLSILDPYMLPESARENDIIVIVNPNHPHWHELKASEGVLNYLRHCVYDAIAECLVLRKAARIDPDTIRMVKDGLLRVSFEMERHGPAG